MQYFNRSAAAVAAVFISTIATSRLADAADSAAADPTAAAGPANAPPPAATPSPASLLSDVHGWVDVSVLNDYITARGLVLTASGAATQLDMGLAFDLYKSKTGPIADVTVYGGKWEDYWSSQNTPKNETWYESDWYAGVKTRFLNNWTLDTSAGQFRSPVGAFNTITWVQSAISYGDAGKWGSGAFVGFNPYLKAFYEVSGPSTTDLGNNGDTYDVEIGAVPTFNLKSLGLGPITLKAPTWVTVGPSSFWSGNNAHAIVPTGPLPASGNLGTFSTGLTAVVALPVPPSLGSWYFKAGFQWYHLINDGLIAAEKYDVGHPYRDPVVYFTGVGFSF